MSIKPFPFNTEMVRAILDGQKTQTRRVVKNSDKMTPLSMDRPRLYKMVTELNGKSFFGVGFYRGTNVFTAVYFRAPCRPGDILWVQEAWSTTARCGLFPPYTSTETHYIYKADDPECEAAKEAIWFSSVHMPKEAARIFLHVKDVRVERLDDMSEEDAMAEGFVDSPAGTDSPLERFSALWDKTIKRADLQEYGIHANPWVWVIEFERCEKPEEWCEHV